MRIIPTVAVILIQLLMEDLFLMIHLSISNVSNFSKDNTALAEVDE